jgi:hypothetical protein
MYTEPGTGMARSESESSESESEYNKPEVTESEQEMSESESESDVDDILRCKTGGEARRFGMPQKSVASNLIKKSVADNTV